MKTLETNMKEMESKKRILEEAVDSLNEEIAKLKAKGNGNNRMEVVLLKSRRRLLSGRTSESQFRTLVFCSRLIPPSFGKPPGTVFLRGGFLVSVRDVYICF